MVRGVSQLTALQVTSRRNFSALAWHGTFTAAAAALAQPTTILPAYIVALGGSPLLVGLMLTVLLAGGVVPELLFAHIVEGRARKRPYFIIAVFSRSGAWFALGGLTLLFIHSPGAVLLLLLFTFLAAFAIGGSLGSVAYTDIYGMSIASGERGRLYGSIQFLGSFAALGVTYAAGILLQGSGKDPRHVYALLFLAIGLLMLCAGIGVLLIREQPIVPQPQLPFSQYLRQILTLWRQDASLRALVTIENIASLHLMLLPFYMLLAVVRLHVSPSAVAFYTMAQVVGGALSNLLWGVMNDRFGSASILRACLALGAILPLLALVLVTFSPSTFFLVFVLLGAAINSRNLAYNNVLVDLAPVALRATYTGLVGTFTAPTLVLPLVGGTLIALFGYSSVFASVALALLIALFTVGRSRALSVPPRG
ncbi:MFS transporter [Alicyclobacillaceae bacterium I2511]|nr:MFS transporter [Alicyclobacillaceae bacterium I2511]